jgi:hypothetical protein
MLDANSMNLKLIESKQKVIEFCWRHKASSFPHLLVLWQT